MEEWKTNVEETTVHHLDYGKSKKNSQNHKNQAVERADLQQLHEEQREQPQLHKNWRASSWGSRSQYQQHRCQQGRVGRDNYNDHHGRSHQRWHRRECRQQNPHRHWHGWQHRDQRLQQYERWNWQYSSHNVFWGWTRMGRIHLRRQHTHSSHVRSTPSSSSATTWTTPSTTTWAEPQERERRTTVCLNIHHLSNFYIAIWSSVASKMHALVLDPATHHDLLSDIISESITYIINIQKRRVQIRSHLTEHSHNTPGVAHPLTTSSDRQLDNKTTNHQNQNIRI